MAYEQKPGDAALFRNDKGDNPNRPDYKGNGLDLDGNKIKLSGWIKSGTNCGKFLSLRIEADEPAPPKPDQVDDTQDDGEMPF